jgi:cysteine synthase A
MNTFADNTLSIGNTPMIRLRKIVSQKAIVYAKIEGRNPAYSVKCRIGAAMVWEAEKRGLLMPGKEIIEPTSGNTGIALCFAGATRGYKVTLVMPETMSIERRKLMKAFGAEVILTDGAAGMSGAISRAEAIAASDPDRYFFPQQFKNPANPAIHEQTTGPEIWKDTEGRVDVFVAGVGTGGTITGVARYLKKMKPACKIVAVEPEKSPVITQTLAGKPIVRAPHAIQGIGAGFVPTILDLRLLSSVELVSDEESMEFARRLAREEGILAGISSGAATAVAARLSALDSQAGKTIVVILPDSGERYLSTSLYDV